MYNKKMCVIPAIDMYNNKIVVLKNGSTKKMTIYEASATEEAKKLERLGVRKIHIVDINGAMSGKIKIAETIKAIKEKTKIEIQAGGGIRDFKRAEGYLKLGVKKIILGTVLAENPDIARQYVENFGKDNIIASIDFRPYYEYIVAKNGWQNNSIYSALELALKLKNNGICEFIFTDISKDGTLEGPSVGFYKNAINLLRKGVTCAGGIGCDKDLVNLSKINGLDSVIVGRAHLENRIDLKKWWE